MSVPLASLRNVPTFVDILCFFNSIAVLAAIELFARLLDDNDIGGGSIVPLLKGSQGLIKVFY